MLAPTSFADDFEASIDPTMASGNIGEVDWERLLFENLDESYETGREFKSPFLANDEQEGNEEE